MEQARLAVGLLLDAGDASRVAALWRALAPSYGADAPRRGPPHLTLAVADPPGDAPALLDALARLAAREPAPALAFHAVGLFPGERTALALLPTVTASLLELHARTLEDLPLRGLHPHHATGAWIPHVTLAKRIEAVGPMAEALRTAFVPFAARPDRLSAHLFPSMRPLGEWPLRRPD